MPNEPTWPTTAAPAVLDDVAAVAVPVVLVLVPVVEVFEISDADVVVDVKVVLVPPAVVEEEHGSPALTAEQNAATADFTVSGRIHLSSTNGNFKDHWY